MSELHHISRLLETIHEARTSNSDRRDATFELDSIKRRPEALSLGLSLAQDRHRPAIIRHGGLSILEHGIRYNWNSYNDDQCTQIRTWVLELAHEVDGAEKPFIRNKVAQLIEEIAEHSWGLEWQDFDDKLLQLWDQSLVHKQIVLSTLETLSDKVFGKDEAAAGPRGAELGKLCVEAFTPSVPATNGTTSAMGSERDEEGWLVRLLVFLEQSLQSTQDSVELRISFSMTMFVLRSSMSWVLLRSLASTNCVALMCHCISLHDAQVNTSALEVLHALYHRTNYSKEEIEKLVCPLLNPRGLSLLETAYERLCVTVDDLDESQYTALKRLSEVVCSMGMFIEQAPWLMDAPEYCDFKLFTQLLIHILRNPSLTVSIPVIYLWTKLLAVRQVRYSTEFKQAMGALLEICRSRLVRYEMMPQNTEDLVCQFLNEDFDTIPEKHAFIGNYRRFCNTIIERIVRRSPFEALSHILTQCSELLKNLPRHPEAQARTAFTPDSEQQLTVEAQCTVVSTAVRSYLHWTSGKNMEEEPLTGDRDRLRRHIETWSIDCLENSSNDPVIQKRLLSTVVDTATSALPSSSRAGLNICERVLSTSLATNLGSDPYDEALRDLQAVSARELQKLAIHFADQFCPVYDTIQTTVETRVDKPGVEQRIRLDHQAFLLTIIQRSSLPTDSERDARLQKMVEPVVVHWEDPRLEGSLKEMHSFLELLGLDGFPKYFMARRAQQVDDWSTIPLDEEGRLMRDSVQRKVEDLPLQATRVLLSLCTTGTQKPEHVCSEMLDRLRPLVPIVLPRLLQFLRLAHAFSNPNKWTDYSPEMRKIVSRIVRDRVWQNGISNESRDAFFQRIKGSRESLEGLASAVRGSIRGVREFSMWIMHSLTHFGDSFYGLYDFPEPLAHALYEDAYWLSPHQLSALLNLSTTLVDKCAPHHRGQFLPPLLIPLFNSLDAKVTAEWEAIARRSEAEEPNGDLETEMKSESVMRNLTHSAVLLASNLLSHPLKAAPHPSDGKVTVRALILTSPQILEPLIVFATHVLRMHDSRSVGVITKVLRSLIPEFQHEEATTSPTTAATIDAGVAASVREFFSTDVLRACVESIHDPYFAESQSQFAALVAAIIHLYTPHTDTPKQKLRDLPEMTEERLTTYFDRIRKETSEKHQRAAALKMLESVRGTSIHEQGKFEKPVKPRRTTLEHKFMTQMAVDDDDDKDTRNGTTGRQSPDLGGVADLVG